MVTLTLRPMGKEMGMLEGDIFKKTFLCNANAISFQSKLESLTPGSGEIREATVVE
jgi:hypothetical protein